MNHFLAATCFVLIFALLAAGSAMGIAADQPNIVLILADDMGYADAGYHGCQDVPTPHIDSIAKQGMRFTDAYANGSFCTPTRAALMSGMYQHRTGNEDLSNVTGPLPQGVKTLPDRLKEAGYTTAMVGKWHLGDKPGFSPNDRGFDSFFGFLGGGHFYLQNPKHKGAYTDPLRRNREPIDEKRYLTDAFGEEAAAFVETQRHATQPFFLYLAFNAVHDPLEATPEYLSRFADIKENRRHIYAAMLSAMDDAIGKVLAKVKEIGKAKQTIVIFHNDNGGPTTRNAVNGSSNAPLRGSKCETFEGGIRVPLAIRWPDVLPADSVYRQPVITMDLTATLVAIANGDATGLEGVDLRPYLLEEKKTPPHDALYWRCRMRSNNYGARQGDWKFVHSTQGAEKPGPNQTPARDMLFNLADDLSEQHDLAEKNPEKLAALKALYEAWSADVDASYAKLKAGSK